MCLIATANDKTLISLKSLEAAYENNSDGWGIVYQRANDELMVDRQLSNFEEFKKAWDQVPFGLPVAVHFRYRTHGDKSIHNVHPYSILDLQDGDPIDIMLMHNGTISGIHDAGNALSDTALYVNKILKPLLKRDPYLMFEPSFQLLVSRDIGTGNKFVFVPSVGNIVIVNKASGHTEADQPGVWYSNSYSLRSAYRASKTSYTPNYYSSNMGGTTRSGTFWESYDWHDYDDDVSTAAPVNKKGRTLRKPKSYSAKQDSPLFHLPQDASEEARSQWRHINFTLLNTTEFLLAEDPISPATQADKRTLRAYGWVRITEKGNSTYEWRYNIARKHKELVELLEEEERKSKATNIINYPTAKEQTVFMSQTEILEWIIESPEDAVEYLIRGGYTGGRLSILAWLNKNLDEAATLIYNMSRYGSFTKPEPIDICNNA